MRKLPKEMKKVKKMVRKQTKKLKKMRKKKHFIRNLIFFLLGLGIILFSILIIWVSTLKIPDFSSFEERLIINSTKIYDKTGEILLYNLHQDIRRTNIPLEKMGINIRNATIAVEDADFYSHQGVKITSTIRAVASNILNIGIGGGGSTITQQLVKNTLLTTKKSIIRKVKEWVLAYKMDNSLPKDKILEYYLNEVPYGGTIYGIEEAAKTYFNKNSFDLTITEAAYLSSIPQSPTVLSPYGKNLDKLENRKNLVLSRMYEVGFITSKEYEESKKEVVVFKPKSESHIKAPHFVFFIKNYLEKKYGEDIVQKGGLNVITTLDYEMQQKAEEYVKEGALKNEEKGGSNASLVAIDPKTGQILSMVGSRDYFDKEIDGNFNVTTARRQPGSSFKPFIYATAFSKGFTPETVLFDLPTEFQTTCNAYGQRKSNSNSKSKCYMPSNYDGKYKGPISLRNALAQSRNIPAVKLFYLSGLKDSLKTAEDMGITTLTDINRYGLTLVIGGGEVSLLDMTSAYGVFANNGYKNKYTGILEIKNKEGEILEEYKKNETQVLSTNIALTISSILSSNEARSPTFGLSSYLNIPGYDVAAKTGTTNSNRDAWLIGYSPSLAVGVWVGNNDNTPMKKGGSAMAGPIWNKFVTNILPTIKKENFDKPYTYVDPKKTKPILRGYWWGNENFFIDKMSGKLATDFTPEETKEEKVITNVHTILYWIDKKDISGPPPQNPNNNPQFNNWETSVQNWWKQNNYKYKKITILEKPTEYDDIHGNYEPEVILLEPNDKKIYQSNETINLKILNKGLYPINKIDIFINDDFVNTINKPLSFTFSPNQIVNIKDTNKLKLIIYDNFYNNIEIVSNFRVGL